MPKKLLRKGSKASTRNKRAQTTRFIIEGYCSPKIGQAIQWRRQRLTKTLKAHTIIRIVKEISIWGKLIANYRSKMHVIQVWSKWRNIRKIRKMTNILQKIFNLPKWISAKLVQLIAIRSNKTIFCLQINRKTIWIMIMWIRKICPSSQMRQLTNWMYNTMCRITCPYVRIIKYQDINNIIKIPTI